MPLPTLAGAIMGGGKVLGAIFGNKAAKNKRKAARAQAKIKRVQSFQNKRAFINKFMTAQADALTAGAMTGADLGSSAVQGQLASQETQARVGINETNEMERLDRLASIYETRAGKAAGIGQMIGAISSIAGMDGIKDSVNAFGAKHGFGEG